MALITRISRLFSADLHAVLDRIEEPEALLRQAIREMEEDLAASEQRIRWQEREVQQLGAREAEIGRSLAELEEQLDICFASAKEDLARALIKRKLESRRLAKCIATKREGLQEALAEQRSGFEDNRRRLEAMRQKAELFAEESQSRAVSGAENAWTTGDFAVGNEEVEVAFLREKQKRSES